MDYSCKQNKDGSFSIEVEGMWFGNQFQAKYHKDTAYLKARNEEELNQILKQIGMEKYDSSKDTLLHIKRVNDLLTECAVELIRRGQKHDLSKLEAPEKELFDEMTPKLKDSTYGSEEYKGYLKELKVALDHHYENNSHHPEHYQNGVDDMDLFDLVEMFMDWKAAGERHADGNIHKSIEHNKTRFNLSEQVVNIFTNTANRYF